MKSVLVVAASARAAAESLRRAGFNVHAADQFGDRETLAASASWEPISDLIARVTRDGANELPVILGGGLLGDLTWLGRLRTESGLTPELLSQIDDPSFLQELAKGAAVAFPETYGRDQIGRASRDILDRVAANPDLWLIKPIRGTGGIGIHSPGRAWHDLADQEILQRKVRGRAIGLCFIATSSDVLFLGATRQQRRRPSRGTYVYGGSVGPILVTPELRSTFERIGLTFTRHVPLEGPFNVDVTVDSKRRVTLLEVNPRFSASMELIERSWSDAIESPCSVYDPIECWRTRLGRMKRNPRVLMKRVIYASCRQRVDPERLQRVSIALGCLVTDTPTESAMVERDEPIATLIAAFSASTLRAEQFLRDQS